MTISAKVSRHERLMAEALAEARQAEGRTRPNPLVGCVVVRDAQIVARGYHARAGQAHAELAALDSLDGPADGCELYVNLEPCCHHGRTPPCTDAIIDAGIDRVYVGTLDPFEEVSGKGISALRAAGVEVVDGVLEQECRRLNRPYFKRITTGLPWVTAKYAMTLDGKIASSSGQSAWISTPASRTQVHRLRDTHDAILVGTNTLKQDNPRLTCRVDGGRDPARVVLDARLQAPVDSKVFDPDLSDDANTLVAVGPAAPAASRRRLAQRGVIVVETPVDEHGHLRLRALLEELARRDFASLLVEGGARLLGHLFDARLIDGVHAFVCPKLVGGAGAPSALAGQGVDDMEQAVELEHVRRKVMGERDIWVSGDVPARHRSDVESTPTHDDMSPTTGA